MGGIADPVQRLTFIEVRGDAAARGRTLLDRFASADRPHVLVLEDIARPERFVLLEEASRAEDLPYDERLYRRAS